MYFFTKIFSCYKIYTKRRLVFLQHLNIESYMVFSTESYMAFKIVNFGIFSTESSMAFSIESSMVLT